MIVPQVLLGVDFRHAPDAKVLSRPLGEVPGRAIVEHRKTHYATTPVERRISPALRMRYTASMDAWPPLPYDAWKDTYSTLHMWTQVVGKIRMANTPPINHWWHVPLYVTSRGLTSSPMVDGDRFFEIDFDFMNHQLHITSNDGAQRRFKLKAMTVAGFHKRVIDELSQIGITIDINTTPAEVPDPIPFEKDTRHNSYDAGAVASFWQVLVQACRVFTTFRSRFLGKVSPVHFFWGSFDLAVTRFSGRTAPPHPGAPGLPLAVTREAYSHEVSSAGFWPGGPSAEAAFYSYAYPEPDGFANASIEPAEAFYSDSFREFMLPYEAVRTASDPDRMLMSFLESTYVAAADLAKWDRPALERGE